jgi:hypothetical protein
MNPSSSQQEGQQQVEGKQLLPEQQPSQQEAQQQNQRRSKMDEDSALNVPDLNTLDDNAKTEATASTEAIAEKLDKKPKPQDELQKAIGIVELQSDVASGKFVAALADSESDKKELDSKKKGKKPPDPELELYNDMWRQETEMIKKHGCALRMVAMKCKPEPGVQDDEPKTCFMHTIGMTTLGQPEFIIRNFHLSLQPQIANALMTVFGLTKQGTIVDNNHGVNTNNMKLVCLTPSTSEAKLLKEEFVTAPGARYPKDKIEIRELFLINAELGRVTPDKAERLAYANIPPRLETLRGCHYKNCFKIQCKESVEKEDRPKLCSNCRSVDYCKFCCGFEFSTFIKLSSEIH